jgi:transcriptional regulator of acetoin/glycerol metabolism
MGKVDILGADGVGIAFSREVMSAWESFMVHGDCQNNYVRDVIRLSWERCRSIDVSPLTAAAPMSVNGEDLRRHQNRHRELLDTARTVVVALEPILSHSRSLLVVTDPQGVILDAYGDPGTLKLGAERHITPGGHWAEDCGGTNAIGTAIASGYPVQVHAVEHYCEGVKTWTCAAALIRDDQGKDILGTIDISGSDDTFNAHSLALAVSTASQIESILKGNEARDLIRLLEWCNAKGGILQRDGLIVLDRKQRIVSANEKAAAALRRLGVPHGIVAGQSLPVGRFGTNGMRTPRPGVDSNNPEWMDPAWMQPVVVDGKTMGYTLVIPDRTPRILHHAASQSASPPISGHLEHSFDKIVGVSEGISAAIERSKRLAQGEQPILVLGETGVGKEEFSKAIHLASRVRSGPFVALNCAALAKDLVASELFGYVDGAFTGAAPGGRRGKFEEADGGTLFLDEIGELPIDVQAHLLRVLQDGIVTRVGENRTRKVAVRVISATNRELRTEIARGLFREDLYYRLAATTLSIPPLRARQRDIPILADYFLELLEQRYGGPSKIISNGLNQLLSMYSWPGNIRELRNVLESMWHLSDQAILDIDDFPPEYRDSGLDESIPQFAGLRGKEREAIIAAIESHAGNMRQAALALGIARSTLYEKMKAYGIRRGAEIVASEHAYR